MLKNAPCWNKLLLTLFSWPLHVNSIYKSTGHNIFPIPNISFIRSTLLCILLLRYRTKQKSDTLQDSIISVCPSIKVSLRKCRLCKSRQIKPYLPLPQALINYRDFSYSILSLSMVTGLDIAVRTTLNMHGTD